MFSATDMKRTCPDAFARFVAYDKVWRDLMLQMSLFMHATACLSVPDLEDALGRLEGEGAALQEALGAYLAAKRRACARLYFLSDGQLLDLLREVRGYVGYEQCEVSNLTLSNAFSCVAEHGRGVGGARLPATAVLHPTRAVHSARVQTRRHTWQRRGYACHNVTSHACSP